MPPNRLAREKSPYLIQHANNPVDWYPWGDEAFARARSEDRPIFLSIGYSTCHWCHVMERESFEKDEVARILAEHFIAIKVDREERPDVDRVYMAYVQATTGSGGWPMSVFLTPDLEPFFGGTYFPPDDRYGRPGFRSLLTQIASVWQTRRKDVVGSARNIVAELRRSETAVPGEDVGADTLERGYMQFAAGFDRKHAGFGGAPKFPRPSTLNFVLRWFARSGSETAANMVLSTQHMMARGGMFDQLGGGFHRYSVDATWHVPHFEKMLYDQAQLVSSYLDGFAISGEPYLADVARSTCDYVLRDLALPDGAFASAEDADSMEPGADPATAHKKEGAFYVWTAEDIDALLGADAAAFKVYYGVEPNGNAEDPHGELTGKNILHIMSKDDGSALAGARAKLLAARAARPRPGRDDKALTAWNGMMIGALARAGVVLGRPRYVEAAERAARFIRERMWDGTTLLRRFRDGDAAIEGYLDDHANLAAGLLDLFEATWDPAHLRLAEEVTERAIALFHDEKDGAFFSTTGRDPSVLVRMKEDWDGAEPAGSSVMAGALLRLCELGRPEWRELVDGTVKAFSGKLAKIPQALPQMLCVLDGASRPGAQIVVAGEVADPRTQALLAVVNGRFLPGRTLLVADERIGSGLAARMPWIAGMGAIDGRPAAYVCKDHTCDRPVTEPDALAAALPASVLS